MINANPKAHTKIGLSTDDLVLGLVLELGSHQRKISGNWYKFNISLNTL